MWTRRIAASALLCFGVTGLQAQTAAEQPPVQVLSDHWVALHFEPQYPHGRHTQNPLPGASLKLPIPESQMIKGQAGQSSDNTQDTAEFRIPVPDFAADAVVDRAVLLANMTGGSEGVVSLDGQSAKVSGCLDPSGPPFHILGGLQLACAPVTAPLNPAEFTIELHASAKSPVEVFDDSGPLHTGPILFLHTRDAMAKRAGWSTTEQSGLDMPKMEPLFDQFLRDTSICLAGDGNYYMTGTTGGPEMMIVTSDLSVWKSPDLQHWSPVRDLPRQSTVVWNIDRDGTWMKPITMRDGEPFRPLWAPEIHYINHTFWIPFSVPRQGITILKSTTGKAEGPYEIAIKPDKPLSTGIDASLFQDDEGTVYSLYGGGWIAKMKPDMSGLAEPYRHIVSKSGREVGFEGVYLFKDKGRYYLTAADFVLGEYNTYVATADSLAGPWSERYLAVPHAGHANFFRDKQGRMWSTFFGNDRHSAFHAKPGIVPMVEDSKGRWRPDASYVAPKIAESTAVQLPGAIGPSNGEPQQVGVMPAVAK
ncbi:MAG TPA: family 43 glycosylhydrolase [Acidobacteriaceae bacterium]